MSANNMTTNIVNEQGLLCSKGPDGKLQALGFMINFGNRGVFSPDGKVEITPADMEVHNKILSEAELKGLDENCQIGQRGTFYYVGGKVSTFTGVEVSTDVRVKGTSITFTRHGKVFRGRRQSEADCFNFRRVK